VSETDDTRAIVQDMYDAYVRGDFDRIAAHFDEDIDWVIHAPRAIFPFAGRRRGRAAVLEALGQIGVDYVIDQYRPQSMIVDGDRAAVISDVVFVQRGSERRLNFRIVDLIKLRDGRVADFEEFIDTFDVVEQALGQHIVIV
jgi:ketosteroid isomerase-like protein